MLGLANAGAERGISTATAKRSAERHSGNVRSNVRNSCLDIVARHRVRSQATEGHVVRDSSNHAAPLAMTNGRAASLEAKNRSLMTGLLTVGRPVCDLNKGAVANLALHVRPAFRQTADTMFGMVLVFRLVGPVVISLAMLETTTNCTILPVDGALFHFIAPATAFPALVITRGASKRAIGPITKTASTPSLRNLPDGSRHSLAYEAVSGSPMTAQAVVSNGGQGGPI